MESPQTNLNDTYYLTYVDVCCKVSNRNFDIVVPNERIKNRENKWVNDIECYECKKSVVSQFVNFLKNINGNNNRVNVADQDDDHNCNVEAYTFTDISEYEKKYEDLCKLRDNN